MSNQGFKVQLHFGQEEAKQMFRTGDILYGFQTALIFMDVLQTFVIKLEF